MKNSGQKGGGGGGIMGKAVPTWFHEEFWPEGGGGGIMGKAVPTWFHEDICNPRQRWEITWETWKVVPPWFHEDVCSPGHKAGNTWSGGGEERIMRTAMPTWIH